MTIKKYEIRYFKKLAFSKTDVFWVWQKLIYDLMTLANSDKVVKSESWLIKWVIEKLRSQKIISHESKHPPKVLQVLLHIIKVQYIKIEVINHLCCNISALLLKIIACYKKNVLPKIVIILWLLLRICDWWLS